MEKIFHWTNTFKTLGESEDGSVDIKGLASTNALDRTGDVIDHDAWVKNGGLDNFKDWLKLRTNAFSQAAITYGLPYPKGLLLVGVQGTGKSVAAKTIAYEWELPLLRLDFGRLLRLW